jgi:23S rRNA-intervening sequence protein
VLVGSPHAEVCAMNIVYSSHEKLDVWQRALMLAEHIYRMTAHFPIQERYGLSA